MKTFSVFAIAALFMVSCNNETGKAGDVAKSNPLLDSLELAVDKAHIAGMSKMGKLNRLQNQVNHLLDSISKLPATAKAKITSYRSTLDSLAKDLNYADFAMNKWMDEFYKVDSSIKDPHSRIEFLQLENEKVTKVKEAILNGIQKADSVLTR